RYLKLFRLMTTIEGDADTGYTITVDGPASLFGASTRYGLHLAKFLPALLHVSRWEMAATLAPRTLYDGQQSPARFTLDAGCKLVSHYKKGAVFDSILEQSFAASWAKAKTEWRLEREVELVPVPGSVMVPDFRLVHPDGRTHVLHLCSNEFKPSLTGLRKALTVGHEVKEADINEGIEDTLGRFQQGNGLLAQVTG
ncbi:MAG: DUF790 family protein, partial [Deinococcota bacterium]|nr:DUF790 family protein [Deinococcota bacterium]